MRVQTIAVAVTAAAAAGFLLLCTAARGRWVLLRRRLASWDAEWRAADPKWSSRC